MAPAVPFALLGVVQLLAVAGWVGLAGAAAFPKLRRRVTPVFVVGALVLAAADGLTAVQFGPSSSAGLGWLRVVGLAMLAVGAAGGVSQSPVLPLSAGLASADVVAGVVVPLGAGPSPAFAGAAAGVAAAAAAWTRGRRRGADGLLGAALAVGFLLSGATAALAAPARHSATAGVVLLAIRAAATVAIAVALVLIARTTLLGKLAGAILVGVVAMAAGAVGVVGTGVAGEVQAQQSQRLLQVAQSAVQTLNALSTRAAVNAQVVTVCPQVRTQCLEFLTKFSDQPDYFAVLVQPPHGIHLIATNARVPLSNVALVQLAGSPIVHAALQPDALPQTAAGGPFLLPGNPPTLAIVEAAPGRPGGVSDARVKPILAGVYGVGIVDSYLKALSSQIGYDVSVVADGQVVASNLSGSARAQLLSEAGSARVEGLDASVNRVVPAQSKAPTAAFVAVTQAGNGDVRIATLVISQPANEALRAQRSVLQRMFLTALVALLVVVLLAIALARRIADPIRRLTVAAGRVRRGDLESTTSVRTRDEVGLLARAFDAMTSSLRTATEELRTAATQEAALRARLETVVESMSDGLVVTDARGRITSVNATAAALLDVGVDQAVGQQLREVLDVVDDAGRSLLDATADRRTVEGRLTSSAGASVPVRYSSAPLANRQGRVVVVADRSREDDVERMKTEFLANVSHELRTPLTPIRGYAELLARRTDLSREQVGSFVDEILSSTARMSRVVELLVDVAALEAGRVAPEQTKESVRSLVEGRVQAWKGAYPERAGDLRRSLGQRLPAVDIDVRWVNRALDELADNAVKYSPAGSHITLVARLTDDERHVRVAVRDNGPGFDPAQAAQLVGDFSQADASETRRVGGMGLGLGFVNRVAERFDLHLTVDAEAGSGAEFALLLPVWDAPPAPHASTRSAKSSARNKKAR